jgi:hypothetical protein
MRTLWARLGRGGRLLAAGAALALAFGVGVAVAESEPTKLCIPSAGNAYVKTANAKGECVSTSTKKYTLVELGKEGKEGKPGVGAVAWAEIERDGTVMKGSNVTGVEQFSPGNYVVTFNKDVSECGVVGSISGDVGDINAYATGEGNVYVGTNSGAGPGESKRFTIAVFC